MFGMWNTAVGELNYYTKIAEQQKIAEKYVKEQMEMAMQNKLMTKEDAYAKCNHIMHSPFVIDTLVALGLIEFRKEDVGFPIGFEVPFNRCNDWNDCMDALRRQGFKIVR